ncbi:MAG: right-handed parallel beta-helix repeat-containing protein [Phycisphaerae bacterium]|nr:right-handed parallel beta-helix repeat-containing protein [Phycisphaerae bacterium]
MVASSPADFHVAVNGKDTNPGTKDKPFATVRRARDAIRAKVAVGLAGDVLVLIHGGVYSQTEAIAFGPQDSGTEKFSITYAAVPGEKVVLSGGRQIAGWKKGEGNIWTAELPDVKAGKWYFRQLFVNDRRAIRARTPNIDAPWWKLASVKREGVETNPAPEQGQLLLGKASKWNDPAELTISVDHPIAAWKNPADVEVVWLYNNDASRKRLGSIDEKAQTVVLKPPFKWVAPSLPFYCHIGYPVHGRKCYFENAAEFLDQPGEWYLDRSTGVLSYWPRAGEDMTKASVVAPVAQNTLLAVTGAKGKPVRNLHFKGLKVAYADWPLPPEGFLAWFGAMIVDFEPPAGRLVDPAVRFEHAVGCGFTDGEVAHASGQGILLGVGCARIVVEGNDIHDLGAGGISAGGSADRDDLSFFPKAVIDIEGGEHTGLRIANNHVHDCGHEFYGAIGILLGLARDSTVAHNWVHDISYAGIVSGGDGLRNLNFMRNCTIEYNHVHDVMKTAVDGAGIYLGGNFAKPYPTLTFRGNLIHDIRPSTLSTVQNPVAGIYLDGISADYGVKGYVFEDNVVYNVGQPVNFNHCTREQQAWRNNVLQTAEPAKDALEAIRAKAGLEPRYRAALSATQGGGMKPGSTTAPAGNVNNHEKRK